MATKRVKSASGSSSRASAPKQTETHPATPPSREQIARLAEKYWAERGHPEGSPEQDWLRAEHELMGKAS